MAEPCPWVQSSSKPPPWLSNIQKGTPALFSFSCVAGQFASGPLARPCLGISKQVIKQAYILQARAHSLLQALDKHIGNIKHIKHSYTVSSTRVTGVDIELVFCIVPKCLLRSLCPEAIVTSFLYSVSYRAHGGAIVAVFVSVPKRSTRQRQAQGTSLVVCFILVSLTLLSHMLPVAGTVLSYCHALPSLLLAGLSQK